MVMRGELVQKSEIVTEISSLHQGPGEALRRAKALPQGRGAMRQGTVSFRATGRRQGSNSGGNLLPKRLLVLTDIVRQERTFEAAFRPSA
jgi:hypothetical protein